VVLTHRDVDRRARLQGHGPLGGHQGAVPGDAEDDFLLGGWTWPSGAEPGERPITDGEIARPSAFRAYVEKPLASGQVVYLNLACASQP